MTSEQAKEIVERLKKKQDWYKSCMDGFAGSAYGGISAMTDYVEDRGSVRGLENAIEIIKEVMGDGG